MVLRLTQDNRSEVVGVLSEAFFDYPVMRHVLSDAGTDYRERLELLIGVFVDSRFAHGSPVLGVEVDGRLVAAALVDEPSPPIPDPPRRSTAPVWARLGRPAYERIMAFEAESSRLQPDVPHYFVGMVGVRPEHQGRGLARRLLDEIARMSTADAASEAVGLSTEDERNLSFYRRLGFRITGEATVGDLRTWHLMLDTP